VRRRSTSSRCWAVAKKPTLVLLNVVAATTDFTFDAKTQRLEIDLTNVKANG
jgi:hypothetical protein